MLSYGEFRKGISEALGTHLNEEQIEQLILIFDADNDGSIEYNEFLKEIKLLGKAMVKEKNAHAASFTAAKQSMPSLQSSPDRNGNGNGSARTRASLSSWIIGLDGVDHSDEDVEEGGAGGSASDAAPLPSVPSVLRTVTSEAEAEAELELEPEPEPEPEAESVEAPLAAGRARTASVTFGKEVDAPRP